MRIRIRYYEDIAILAVGHQLNTRTMPSVSQAVDAQMTVGYRHFVINFKRVDFLTSAGVRGLLVAQRAARARGGGLCVANVGFGLRSMLPLLGGGTQLLMFPNVMEAIASYLANRR